MGCRCGSGSREKRVARSGVSMERASIKGADEEVCRVGGTWIGLDIPTEKQCGRE